MIEPKNSNQSGFILVALLVAMIIIALGFVFVYNSTKKTKDQAVEQLDTSLQGAQKSVDQVREQVDDLSAQRQKKFEDAEMEIMK